MLRDSDSSWFWSKILIEYTDTAGKWTIRGRKKDIALPTEQREN